MASKDDRVKALEFGRPEYIPASVCFLPAA